MLHVGESYTDVPPTNPFYRFIETLLHNAVTGGCNATEFCPTASTSREQMAVFVLVAEEGAGYPPRVRSGAALRGRARVQRVLPVDRGAGRRGVVTGCGGGNFCPALPVSRDQMAVFVLRTLEPALKPPPCAPPNLYADVPETNPFCRWIEELTVRGVVTGCGGGDYSRTMPSPRPDGRVHRRDLRAHAVWAVTGARP